MPIDLPTEQPAVPPFPTTLPNQDPMNIGQPTYLANLVIETNDGLQLFRGLPPNVAPVPPYNNADPGNSSMTAFARDVPNIVFSMAALLLNPATEQMGAAAYLDGLATATTDGIAEYHAASAGTFTKRRNCRPSAASRLLLA